jgi:hypothetical protein
VALKVLGAAVLVSATVAGATVVHRARHAPVARVAVSEKTRAPSPPRRTSGPVAAPEASAPATEPPPAASTVSSSDAHAGSIATKRRVEAIVPSAPAVADEASLVHAGVVARRAGQPVRALQLFDKHARLYPQGVLAEERDVERALALADLGRVTEARAAIDRFLQAHPASPLAPRLLARARLLEPANP